MTKMTSLLERNEQFARTYTPAALGIPAQQVLIVTCLDHRTDPAIVLGLQLGDAPVIRNAGGRVTQAVIDDIAYLAFLAEQLFGGQGAPDTLFEVAVVHHTQCGTGFLADPGFRHRAADGDRPPRGSPRSLRRRRPAHHRPAPTSSACSPHPRSRRRSSVSGHVYDIATGRVTTIADARYPSSPVND